MEQRTDRRVRKTRKLIQEALFSLMSEMPFRKIRINQITERADISRSTFYLHFETKDQVLLSVVDEMIDEYFQSIYQAPTDSHHSPAYLFFHKWKHNIDKMHLVLDAGMEYHIYERLRILNTQRKPLQESENPLLNDYIRTMVDGAHFALLLRWTRDKARIPVEQMDRLFRGMQIPEMFERLEKELQDFGVLKTQK